jgi:hypothetical protein
MQSSRRAHNARAAGEASLRRKPEWLQSTLFPRRKSTHSFVFIISHVPPLLTRQTHQDDLSLERDLGR